jgi:3-dehydroquinate dehydratase-2
LPPSWSDDVVRVLVLHGPNLGHLGRREPHRYGTETLAELDARIVAHGTALGFDIECRQTNHEGVLIDWLLAGTADAVVMNAGALAHTSLALADAVRCIAPTPVIEVHLTNTVARDEVRHTAIVGAACRARLEGFGGDGYLLALDGLVRLLRRSGDER